MSGAKAAQCHLLVQVDVLLDEVDDELCDGVRVVERVQHRVREVSPAQDAAPGAVLAKLGPSLDLIDGPSAGHMARLDVGGPRQPGDFPVEVVGAGQLSHDVSVCHADGRRAGHVFCE